MQEAIYTHIPITLAAAALTWLLAGLGLVVPRLAIAPLLWLACATAVGARLGDDALGGTVAIHLRRVDRGHAEVDSRAQRCDHVQRSRIGRTFELVTLHHASQRAVDRCLA